MRAAVRDLNDAGRGAHGGNFMQDATRGMQDFEKAAAGARSTLGDGESEGGLTRNVRRSKNALEDFGSTLQKIGQMIDGGSVRGPLTFLRNLFAAPFGLLGGGASALGGLFGGGGGGGGAGGGALASISPAAAAATAGVLALGAALLALPAAAAAVQFAASAITLSLTMLAAVVWGLLGPLGVLFTVLGGIGLAAMLGFKNAMASSGPEFHAFRAEISGIKDNFQSLTHHLAQDFMPWFLKVGSVVKDVLGYFNKLAVIGGKDGLSGVFKSLSGGGFARLNSDFLKIVGPIGDVISRVVAFAFGRGGNEGQQILRNNVHRFADWVSHTASPFLKWFDKQHFENTGKKWANEILNSPAFQEAAQKIGQIIVTILGFAAQRAWATFKRWAAIEFAAIPGIAKAALHEIGQAFSAMNKSVNASIINVSENAWNMVKQVAIAAWNAIKSAASAVWNAIRSAASAVLNAITSKISGPLTSAWDAVSTAASAVWSVVSSIASAIQAAVGAAQNLASALSNISVPSIPGSGFAHQLWNTVTGNAAGTPNWRGGLTWVGEQGPELVNLPRGSAVYPHGKSMAMAGGGVTIVMNSVDLSTPEQRRRIASEMASLLGSHRAGGGF